jgi:hypothetical protein
VNQINQTFTGKRAGTALTAIAIVFGAFVMVSVSCAWSAATGTADIRCQHRALQLAAEDAAPATAPEDSDQDDKDVPTSQVDKYISVYESMQKDHSLTVEQAASKQGLTVAQFRSLENKIEADDTLRERVRKALRHAANPNDKESSDD